MPFAHHSIQKTSRPAATFLLSAAWIVLSLAVGREITQLVPAVWGELIREAVSAALLFGGFYAMAKAFVPELRPLSSVGFVRRPGLRNELGRGLALGWGVAIALVLPALLTGNLSMTFAWDATVAERTLLSVLTLLAFALVVQLVLAGLPVRMLLKATNPGITTAAVVFVVALLALTGPASQGRSLPVMVLSASLFLVAFLRTRALWLPLGIHIGWTLSLQMLFGLPSPYTPVSSGIVQGEVGGPAWLTGGSFGPEASAVSVMILVAAMIVLVKLTKDDAWHYTWQPVEGAGYAMEVPPPAEHLREEKKHVAAAAPLVQIAGAQMPRVPGVSSEETRS